MYWYNSKQGFMLSRMRFKIAKLSIEKTDAEEALEDTLNVRQFLDVLKFLLEYI